MLAEGLDSSVAARLMGMAALDLESLPGTRSAGVDEEPERLSDCCIVGCVEEPLSPFEMPASPFIDVADDEAAATAEWTAAMSQFALLGSSV